MAGTYYVAQVVDGKPLPRRDYMQLLPEWLAFLTAAQSSTKQPFAVVDSFDDRNYIVAVFYKERPVWLDDWRT